MSNDRITLLIKAMVGIGVLWVVVIIVLASIPQNAPGAPSAKVRLSGFTPAFPARPIPPMPLKGNVEGLTALPGDLWVVHYRVPGCRGCDETERALGALAKQTTSPSISFAVVDIGVAPGPAAEDDMVRLADPDFLFRDYVGRTETRPITILYRRGAGELGRVEGTGPWERREALAFLESLAKG